MQAANPGFPAETGENAPAPVICSSYMISFLISSFPSHLNCFYSKPKEAQQNLGLEKEGELRGSGNRLISGGETL